MINTTITQEMLDLFTTEQSNVRSVNIDEMPVIEILTLINEEDKSVPYVVERQLDKIASLIEEIVAAFQKGGRLIYIGAGTSGRLGVLDASECPPTFGVSASMVQGFIAGGREALVRSLEDAEDDADAGAAAIESINLNANDVLVGITASGQAPYVLGAMAKASERGAVTAAVSCNKESKTFSYAKHAILLDVGPEVVTGSTRMKAGTAQKLVLNMLTTASMIRIGKVYRNLMVDLTPVNKKLVERSKRLIRQATDCSAKTADEAFTASGRRPKIAILMILLGVSRHDAEFLEKESNGPIAEAIRLHQKNAGTLPTP
jgi:N-acetylmuramic acid 6-phosphate etherase